MEAKMLAQLKSFLDQINGFKTAMAFVLAEMEKEESGSAAKADERTTEVA